LKNPATTKLRLSFRVNNNSSVKLPFRKQGEFFNDLLQPEFSLPLREGLQRGVETLA
jgi:hypothetical protein